MAVIALRIDVTRIAGAEKALPLLLPLLAEQGGTATVFFSMGADRSGKSWLETWRLRKQLGWSALAYGRLRPAPILARRCAALIRQVGDHGHECGVMPASRHDWLALLEQRFVAESAFEAELLAGIAAYRELFDRLPLYFSAPDQRMSRSAYRLLQRHGFAAVSAMDGEMPFLPVADGEPVQCLALPVNLPALTTLLHSPQEQEALLRRSAGWVDGDYSLFALDSVDLLAEGALDLFRQLLAAWIAQGHQVRGVSALLETWPQNDVPFHAIEWGGRGRPDREGLRFP
ncbi:polysaccharide deacetylase family protein [Chitinilyticum piscinae]|uniref:Polysaccharide deacetylase family protein n=1 Tax=Chitinilyticum piscinae TaxID=2866724 RepID=A0A8J7FJH0_9NEIS|nr:polysaccharide deacetylase family protein [Chitinilyticum piscinae]MBE9610338.1 polysaccharide deacetylase family protein [Chitinilyticum piscinae]